MTAADAPVLITGAGSGTGRASALALAGRFELVLAGRRPEALEQTAALVRAAGGQASTLPLDVTADDAGDRVREAGPFGHLVLAAGQNLPERSWAAQSLEGFRAVLDANLVGAVAVIDAALPGLRVRGGCVVLVSSVAAKRPSPLAGVGYLAGKTALGALAISLNLEEAASGVRACHLCPGDIDSDFLELRPEPPSAERRRAMLAPEDVARVVAFVLESPPHVRLDEIVITPLGGRDRAAS
jgi:NADP-dependent 3-hydroxy acid dehydrogenase YdfG